MQKRKRIKMVKSELVSSTNYREREQLKRANAAGIEMPSKMRKDSLNLELPNHMKNGLIWEW